MFTGGHVDSRICLISAHFSASGSSAAPSQASRVNCYFKGHPHRGCPMNRGQCLFTSPAWICPNFPPEDLKVALRHPPDSFCLSVLGVWQTFLWCRHRTRHFEDKRLRSMTVSPWCGCQATLVWQPLLPFSCKLSWFCCERFLYMNLWERVQSVLHEEDTLNLSYCCLATPTGSLASCQALYDVLQQGNVLLVSKWEF